MRRLAPFLALIVTGAVCGCSRPETTAALVRKAEPPDPWKIVSTDPNAKQSAYLTNGIIGIRVGADGASSPSSLTFDTLANGGQEILVKPFESLPNNVDTSPLQATDYRQTLDLKTGTLLSHYGDTDTSLRIDPSEPHFHLSVSKSGKPGTETGDPAISKNADAYWREFWKTDIEVDGPIADQQAIRSFLFYLRSSLSPKADFAISPYGLSSEQYKGHVFWDADTWVFPALALLDPERAKQIPAYRLRLQPRYEANSNGHGLRVPWESAQSGREVSPPSSSEEIHVTGAACFGLDMAASLGLADSNKVADFCSKADQFFRSRATKASDGSLEIKSVGSVDESHTVDNDLFTNLLAQWLANGRGWQTGNVHYRIPSDERSLLTYSGDQDRSHKQAAAVLSVFPLQYPTAEAQAQKLLDRYGPITIKQGPAMTDSVEATILARLGKADQAYDQWEHSWMDFVKPPRLLFSEHRATQETYFLTGAAGCLQTVLYGFLGFRIDSHKDAHAAWSTPLQQGKWLNVAPHLPKAWKKVQLRGLQVVGTRYTMTFTPSGVKVERGD